MEDRKEKSKFQKFLILFKKRFRIRMLLILAITFSLNSVAWFIYNNKVESGFGAKVRAWNVLFEVDGQQQVEYIDLNVDDLYPGMPNFHKDIYVTNAGDTNALLSYQILFANVLGDNYVTTDNNDITEYFDTLKSSYPFSISYGFEQSELTPQDTTSFSVDVSWPFESGDDAKDTLWGGKAYDFSVLHPNSAGISIRIKLVVEQVNDDQTGNN